MPGSRGRHAEALARNDDNPVGGWCGLRNGYQDRFAMYVPPLLELLGLVQLDHDANNDRVRATQQTPVKFTADRG